MNIKQTNSLFNSMGLLFGLCGAALLLSACSNEATTWTKSSSPWEKSSANNPAAAPAAATYKADLEMPAEPVKSEVELSYQPEQVESYAPAEVVETEPAFESQAALEEPASEAGTFMNQPADYYTMQLIASVDLDRVMRFAQEEQISTQYIVATERDGVVWHVLLLDVYADYSSAVAARDEIAPSLKNVPWIRRVGSVQKLVIQ